MDLMEVLLTDKIATVCFALAILHTFCVSIFQRLAERYPEGSFLENFFHFIGEVEVVFGIWAAVFLLAFVGASGGAPALGYLEGLNFSEPIFVFAVLAVASTRPILSLTESLLAAVARPLPLAGSAGYYFVALALGPLLGSVVTEPAAMTVIALLLLNRFFSRNLSPKLMYATVGLLFVNVSVGGTLTPFAAPPVLMVASKWNWDLAFMLSNFGWKAALACVISTAVTVKFFYRELASLPMQNLESKASSSPLWLTGAHLLALALIVASVHHPIVVLGLLMLFIGFAQATKEHQDSLKLKEALLVAVFLAGLVVLGQPQRWWLEPLLMSLNDFALFAGALGLTAFTDNAAITYLGTQVPGLTDSMKYALVAGAVAGGGLTVIANAPNPAGFGILNPSFAHGIHPGKLLLGALMPTFVAGICFWLL